MRDMHMDLHQIRSQLDAMEADAALLDDVNLDARARAMLALDLVDAFARLRGRWQDLSAVQARANALRRRLAEIDARLVDEREIRRRLAAWTPPPPAYDLGYRALWIDQVTQAPDGCDFRFNVDVNWRTRRPHGDR